VANTKREIILRDVVGAPHEKEKEERGGGWESKKVGVVGLDRPGAVRAPEGGSPDSKVTKTTTSGGSRGFVTDKGRQSRTGGFSTHVRKKKR